MRTWTADISFALRQLRKAPGFALLAVLTLAFGIGANTAMFTVMENVLLRPLPYAGASRLVAIQPGPGTDSPQSTSWLDYRDIRHGMKNIVDVAGYSDDLAVVQGKDTSTAVAAPHVTPSLLTMLGTRPLLGRTFTSQEGLAGGPQVVLLSEGIWKKVFHADPDIVGKVIHISSVPHTVVGVMPANFGFPENEGSSTRTAVWLPLQPTHAMLTKRGYSFFLILAKLHPGVSMAQAQAQLQQVSKQLADVDHDPARDGSFTMVSYGGGQHATGADGSVCCPVTGFADCMRQCCQSAAGSGDWPSAGVCSASCAGCGPGEAAAAGDDRGRGAERVRLRCRFCTGSRGD